MSRTKIKLLLTLLIPALSLWVIPPIVNDSVQTKLDAQEKLREARKKDTAVSAEIALRKGPWVDLKPPYVIPEVKKGMNYIINLDIEVNFNNKPKRLTLQKECVWTIHDWFSRHLQGLYPSLRPLRENLGQYQASNDVFFIFTSDGCTASHGSDTIIDLKFHSFSNNNITTLDFTFEEMLATDIPAPFSIKLHSAKYQQVKSPPYTTIPNELQSEESIRINQALKEAFQTHASRKEMETAIDNEGKD